MPIDAIGK